MLAELAYGIRRLASAGRVRPAIWAAAAAVLGVAALAAAVGGPTSSTAGGPASRPAAGEKAPARTKAEALAEINRVGPTRPDWWKAVADDWPKGIDVTWAPRKGRPDPNASISLYLDQVVYPDPQKWKLGAKLLDYSLTVNKDNADALKRSRVELASLYQDMFRDYARAGYFWLQSDNGDTVEMAECFWRLGSPAAAEEVLAAYASDETSDGAIIQMWASIGKLPKALAMAEARAAQRPDIAWCAAGDACLIAGDFAKAKEYYQKVLTARSGRDLKRFQTRARMALDAIAKYAAIDLGKVKDGAYSGSAKGYVANVTVEVKVQGRRITSLRVTENKENRALTSIGLVPARVVESGTPLVPVCTSATYTSNAIIMATVAALAAASR